MLDFPRQLRRQEREPNKSLSTLLLCTKKSYYLRYPLWRDKAGGLDHRQACSWEHVYQLDFHPCRNNFLGNNETETALSGFDSTHDGRYNKQISVRFLFLLRCLPITLISTVHSHADYFEFTQKYTIFVLKNKIISVKLQACSKEMIKQWQAKQSKLSQKPCHLSYSVSKKMWNICSWQLAHNPYVRDRFVYERYRKK